MIAAGQSEVIKKRELLTHGLLNCDVQPNSKRASAGVSTDVLAFGSGFHGQLGLLNIGPSSNKKPVPTPAVLALDSDSDPRRVSCGAFHTAVCTNAGQVYTWGLGSSGQLGYPLAREKQPEPKLVAALQGVPITAVACGRQVRLEQPCSTRARTPIDIWLGGVAGTVHVRCWQSSSTTCRTHRQRPSTRAQRSGSGRS